MSMNEQQPDVQWVFPPEKNRTGRVWLIVALVAAVLLISGALAFFLIPRDGGPTPLPSGSPTPDASASATPLPTGSPLPTFAPPTGVPTAPATTPPEPQDPDVATFAGAVGPRLDDALTGLSILEGLVGQDAISVIDQLQQDVQRLSDTPAPSSIDSEWRAGVSSYDETLRGLRQAAADGTDLSGGISSARDAANHLRSIVGL
ncbi:hypothetical protein ACWIBQ_11120 [Microbacterium keratanolyticum]